MPDLRYHLISLISVFLALAIGILLGVAMADRGVVSDRMQAEITSIQQQFARQQQEIGRQNEQIAEQQAMLDGMSEVVISGSLQGENVALVTGPYADPNVSGEVQSDLSEAGANITTVEPLPRPEPNEVTLLENTSPQAMTGLEADYAEVARKILGSTGEVEPGEIVVFVGGGEIPEDSPPGTRDALNAAQTEMFEIWLDAGVRVVGAEPLNSGHSDVRHLFQEVGIPSVTNADEPAGRAAIIECAAMEVCEGTYGTKDTATDPFPSPS